MHPRNDLRLLAGIPIDPLLEKAECYSKDMEGKEKGDYPGKVDGKNDKKSKKKKYGLDHRDAGADSGGGMAEMAPAPDAAPAESPAPESSPKATDNFDDGDIVISDDGIHVVVLSDTQADMLGIIPAGMIHASADEKNRSVKMVKPDVCRKPTEEELAAVRSASAEELKAVDDDMDVKFSAESVKDYDPPVGREAEMDEENKHKEELSKSDTVRFQLMGKKGKSKKKKAVKEGLLGSNDSKIQKRSVRSILKAKDKKTKNSLAPKGSSLARMTKEGEEIKESTHNYKGHQISHEDSDSDPINVVGQGEKQWANSLDSKEVRSEYTQQTHDRGEQSSNESEEKVKVPAAVKSELKKAIKAFRDDAARQGNTHTQRENAVMYEHTADAFEKLLDLLNQGTIMSLKKAQIHASSLMGPMLHKLPDVVWDFVVNGGQKKSLKDYMIKIGDKK